MTLEEMKIEWEGEKEEYKIVAEKLKKLRNK